MTKTNFFRKAYKYKEWMSGWMGLSIYEMQTDRDNANVITFVHSLNMRHFGSTVHIITKYPHA